MASQSTTTYEPTPFELFPDLDLTPIDLFTSGLGKLKPIYIIIKRLILGQILRLSSSLYLPLLLNPLLILFNGADLVHAGVLSICQIQTLKPYTTTLQQQS